jgi:hypothetical protein
LSEAVSSNQQKQQAITSGYSKRFIIFTRHACVCQVTYLFFYEKACTMMKKNILNKIT